MNSFAQQLPREKGGITVHGQLKFHLLNQSNEIGVVHGVLANVPSIPGAGRVWIYTQGVIPGSNCHKVGPRHQL